MNPYSFLKDLERVIAGEGFVREKVFSLADLRNTDGSAIGAIGAGDFGLAAAETNGLALKWNASDATAFTLNLALPGDYDGDKDSLKLRLFAQSAGDTDTPALDATVYRKRAGAALSADLDPTISDAVPNNTAKGGVVEINVSGKSCQPGDVLHVTVTPGAHTTDALFLYGLTLRYRSNLVLTNPDER